MRTGSELVRATKPFSTDDPAKTWRLFATTVAIHVTLLTAVLVVPWWPVKALLSVLISLVLVRLFIFYHDYLHGAIFRDSTLGRVCMTVIGYYQLAVPSVWKQSHNYHHQNNAKLLGSAIGSYPLVSVGIYSGLTPTQKRLYAAVRSPWNMIFGLFTVFGVGMCLSPFRRDPKEHWGGPLALVLWIGALVGLGAGLGWQAAFFALFLPGFISSALGAYLFYAQHNFPDAKLRDRRSWDYSHAALKCSSMFEMSPVLHWFTGNIGYHHVHHLNHKIPFYRLPEAMAAMPELQEPGRTSWDPADVWACLSVDLWDPESQRVVTFEEAERILSKKAAVAV